MMRQPPRTRRLYSDFRAIQQLKADSTLFDFQESGDPPDSYVVHFHGRGLWKPEDDSVRERKTHRVEICLGAQYPRAMPSLAWRTPIFHPNISASGIVCLGGYGTHWVPSLSLDHLCEMLWDMIRYKNFDVDSPYNREAARWARGQPPGAFPTDRRPIRDKLASAAAEEEEEAKSSSLGALPQHEAAPGLLFVDGGVVEAEVVEPEDPDILFIQ